MDNVWLIVFVYIFLVTVLVWDVYDQFRINKLMNKEILDKKEKTENE